MVVAVDDKIAISRCKFGEEMDMRDVGTIMKIWAAVMVVWAGSWYAAGVGPVFGRQ